MLRLCRQCVPEKHPDGLSHFLIELVHGGEDFRIAHAQSGDVGAIEIGEIAFLHDGLRMFRLQRQISGGAGIPEAQCFGFLNRQCGVVGGRGKGEAEQA